MLRHFHSLPLKAGNSSAKSSASRTVLHAESALPLSAECGRSIPFTVPRTHALEVKLGTKLAAPPSASIPTSIPNPPILAFPTRFHSVFYSSRPPCPSHFLNHSQDRTSTSQAGSSPNSSATPQNGRSDFILFSDHNLRPFSMGAR